MTLETPDAELLSAYLDDECTPAERALVDTNLERDATWRAALADLQAARDTLRALPWREPSAGFLEQLLAPESASASAPKPGRTLPRAFGALSAVAAAVVGLVLVATPGRDKTAIEPQLATLSADHGATTSLEGEPVSNLAPVVVPVRFEP